MESHKSYDQPWLLERRAFLKMGAGCLLMSLGWANPAVASLLEQQQEGGQAAPRNSARNCLLIGLRGGPSHVDTFDIKVGPWTPRSLGVEKIQAGYLWPLGIMPNLAQRAGKFSIVRSLQHQEVVHERAQYYMETGRRLNPGLRTEIPNIGSVIALEFAEKRAATAVFPNSIYFNYGNYSSNGFLSPAFAPFTVTNPTNGISNLQPADGLESFERRRSVLDLVNDTESGPADSGRQTFNFFQSQAEKLMRSPVTAPTFTVSDADKARYGAGEFGVSLAITRNLFKANLGTHFIEVDQYGWDQHTRIYEDERYGLFPLARELDKGLSALLDDLAASPGVGEGKSLLDETLILVIGEFGRTVGELNRSEGRDHYPYAFSCLFAGGGVKGGRVVGATNDLGGVVFDNGWNRGRAIHMPDLVTTIYSALGIDWTKTLTNTPSGRIFRYADPEAVGDQDSFEITPLF